MPRCTASVSEFLIRLSDLGTAQRILRVVRGSDLSFCSAEVGRQEAVYKRNEPG